MSRHRPALPLLIAAWLALAASTPPLAAEPGKAELHPAVRPFTTAELAGWLCKALPGNDGRKLAATLFDGKVPGESDAESWSALVTGDGKDLIDVTFMGTQLLDDVGAWVLVLELEGDWHGISEEEWVALARRIPGRVEKGEHRGQKICGPDKRTGCDHRGGYEARPGVRWLQIVWGTSGPHPSTWFCPKG